MAIVAVSYLFALSGAVLAIGGLNVTSWEFLVSRAWIILPATVFLAVLGTQGLMWRFGHLFGSKYFIPTVAHAAVILLLTFGVVKELMG